MQKTKVVQNWILHLLRSSKYFLKAKYFQNKNLNFSKRIFSKKAQGIFRCSSISSIEAWLSFTHTSHINLFYQSKKKSVSKIIGKNHKRRSQEKSIREDLKRRVSEKIIKERLKSHARAKKVVHNFAWNPNANDNW